MKRFLILFIACSSFFIASSQVTSVSQLKDVKTTDTYYESLRNLIERWGVVGAEEARQQNNYYAGKPLSRKSFVITANAALRGISQLMGGSLEIKDKDVAAKIKKEYTEARMKGYHDPAVLKINSVSQYKDVKPTAEYYRALQSLVEEYKLVIGSAGNVFSPTNLMTFAELYNIFKGYSNISAPDIIKSSPKIVTRGDWAIILNKLLIQYENDLNKYMSDE